MHDPWRPVPSLGGHGGIPAGAFDRANIDCRSDVLTYTTDCLLQPLRVAGNSTVKLFCRADAPSFDVSAILSDVHADGRVINLTQGHICINPSGQQSLNDQPTAEVDDELPQAGIHRVHLHLQPTCFVIPTGHSLRLSLAAACFPAYAVNSGSGRPAGQSRRLEQRIITLQILHGPDHPSKIELPLDLDDAL